ncbi:MAG: hypothetical protein ABUS57_02200 [Pseudomonadota bacterium]
MGLAKAGRQRLLLSAIAVFALGVAAATSPAPAQPSGSSLPGYCGQRPSGGIDNNPSSARTAARFTFDRAAAYQGDPAPMVSELLAQRDNCSNAVRTAQRKNNIDAIMCVGQANELLAKISGQASYYDQAVCQYLTVGALGNSPVLAESQYRLGHTYEARNAAGDASYAADAYAAAASRATQHPEWYLDLARVRVRDARSRSAPAGDPAWNAANAAYISGAAGLNNIPPQAAAQALVDQAGIQPWVTVNQQSSVDLLTNARRYAGTSASILESLGEAFLAQNRLDDATANFRAAALAPPGVDSSPAGRNEANYYLGVIAARSASSAASWADVVQTVSPAGRSEFRYRRELCLARIAQGGKIENLVRDSNMCEGEQTAEGQLLLGMYYLRLAQLVPYIGDARGRQAWADYLAHAEMAFTTGKTYASALPPDRRVLRWQGVALNPSEGILDARQRTSPQVSEALDFGLAVTSFVRNSFFATPGSVAGRTCRDGVLYNHADPGAVASAVVFTHYDVIGCLPSNQGT